MDTPTPPFPAPTSFEVLCDNAQWHHFLPQMVKTFLIENESDMTADVTIVYGGRAMNNPDDLTTIMVSGARGKVLAKEIRGTRVVQIGEGRIPDRLPHGYGMRQFTKDSLFLREWDSFDAALVCNLAVSQAEDLMNLVEKICDRSNFRVTFEWIASEDGIATDTSYNWSGIITPEQDAAADADGGKKGAR
jgi:hypothetical protein